MSPRPILKRSSSCTATPHPHAVHFPPSPSLTTHTYSVYSAQAYDRSPIVVAPNSCALPERGCPGRTYTLDEQQPPSPPTRSTRYGGRGDLHPRALAFYAPLPPLIPDLSSSESDESDALASPAHETSIPEYTPAYHYAFPVTSKSPGSISPSALAFLPHPYDAAPAKPRRRREPRHDSSRTPDRIPGSPTTPTKRCFPRAAAHVTSSFAMDDGCLGGF